MNKERDLLPWILGGLSAATIAVAFAAVSAHRAAPASAPTPLVAAQAPASPSASPALPAPAPAAAPTPPPEASSTAEADPAPLPVAQSAGEPQIQPGQIWQCTSNGVKTFSNNPCGDKSTLLEVGPINTMRPTPAMHYARAYEPRYSPGYADQSAPSDDEDYSDQYPAESGGNSYTIIQGAGFVPRRRADHFHRPHIHHNPGQDPAHNSGHNAGHNPAPMRHY